MILTSFLNKDFKEKLPLTKEKTNLTNQQKNLSESNKTNVTITILLGIISEDIHILRYKFQSSHV